MPHPGEALRKVTLNLYEKDVEWLKDDMGEGWSTWVRDVVRRSINHQKQIEAEKALEYYNEEH